MRDYSPLELGFASYGYGLMGSLYAMSNPIVSAASMGRKAFGVHRNDGLVRALGYAASASFGGLRQGIVDIPAIYRENRRTMEQVGAALNMPTMSRYGNIGLLTGPILAGLELYGSYKAIRTGMSYLRNGRWFLGSLALGLGLASGVWPFYEAQKLYPGLRAGFNIPLKLFGPRS